MLRENGSGTRDTVTTLLSESDLTIEDIDISLALPSNETVRAAVEAGAGVTVLSRLVVENAIETGKT